MGGDSLAEARATIERQAAEIDRLQRQLADARFAEELRQSLILSATAGTIASPVKHTRLLEMIVETAAHVIRANAGSLFLIDEETQELVFEVALGQKAEEVKKFRVPLGHGIAGLVAVSGQPMAISDASSDARQATDIAEKIDYKPESILCVPLVYNDQIIGVLELLDKEGAPSFTPDDMEALFLFGNQAAVAIEQSRTQHNLAALLGQILQSIDGLPESQRHWLQDRSAAFVSSVEEDSSAYRQALELAQLVQEIVWQGEDEVGLCRTILQGFASYARTHQRSGGELGGLA
ncbi:MAG: GAF domain-containing protein [Chloroflexi bacterium]|nr:GAF domain-containing protein [Chloroflexota bacterium]